MLYFSFAEFLSMIHLNVCLHKCDGTLFVQVLCFAARQTTVFLMGEEDGGQAGKGAGEGVFFEA